MKRGILVVFIAMLFLLPGKVCGQKAVIDSLKIAYRLAKSDTTRIRLLNTISEKYLGLNADSAEEVAHRAIDLSRKTKNKKGETKGLINLGQAVSKKGDEEAAIDIFREGHAIAKGSGDKIQEGDIHRAIGNSFYHIALYDSALTSYFNALSLFKEAKDTLKTAAILNNIGNVCYFMKRTAAAETFYTQALEKYIQLNDIPGLAKQYGNLGLVYIETRDTLKALEYSKKSLGFNLKVGALPGIATSYVNLAYAYKIAGDYKPALECANKSLKIRRDAGDKKGIAIATIMIGNIYYESGEYEKAVKYYEEGRSLSEEVHLRVYEYEDLEYLARSYLVMGNRKKASELFKIANEMEDSLFNDKLSASIAEVETQYKTEEKESQIKIQELSLKRRSAYLWGAAGFILLLWLILGISYNAYRNKQKTNILLEKQNKEITRQKQEITDSIHYAQTIQRAILPPEKLLQEYLPDSFVIFKPKDIVSGDFYWTEKVKDRVYFAVVDCTGHGVPGAFMSIIGHNGLNRAVKDFKLVHPGEILDKLVELVTEALHAENQREIKDGMDIALCYLDLVNMKLEYAGAYNPVYIFRNKEIMEFKADRQPIGSFEKRSPFTTHEVKLEKGDCIYVFSDGIIDQFGGEKGKKLSSKRMKEILAGVVHLNMRDQYAQLKTTLEEWQGDHEQTDDVTLVGVRI